MIVESEEDRLAKEDGITGNIRAHEDDYFRKKDRELIENLRNADVAARQRSVLELTCAVLLTLKRHEPFEQ